MSEHTCKKHGHSYIEHYKCYKDEIDTSQERIAFFDIETTNLNADYGQMISYCIKPNLSDEIIYGLISKADLKAAPGEADKRIVKKCIKDLENFDKVVTFYGARFDIPFLRTRARVNGIDFPGYGGLEHKDLWFTVRGKFKLSSNRLENACRVLLGQTNKTRIEPRYWHGALIGDKESLDFVLEHNKYDVIDLENLYNAVIGYARPQAASI
jgi:uncharacterized protein YprB with RNaseH-like and TPR domain